MKIRTSLFIIGSFLLISCSTPSNATKLKYIHINQVIKSPQNISVNGATVSRTSVGGRSDSYRGDSLLVALVYEDENKNSKTDKRRIKGIWIADMNTFMDVSYQDLKTGESESSATKRLKRKASKKHIRKGDFVEFGEYDTFYLYKINKIRYEIGVNDGTVRGIGKYDFDWMCEHGPPMGICD